MVILFQFRSCLTFTSKACMIKFLLVSKILFPYILILIINNCMVRIFVPDIYTILYTALTADKFCWVNFPSTTNGHIQYLYTSILARWRALYAINATENFWLTHTDIHTHTQRIELYIYIDFKTDLDQTLMVFICGTIL